MTFLKKIAFALVALVFTAVGSQTASAQTNQNNNQGVWDKITKAVQGESKQQTFYNNRTKQKMSVTVKDISWSDMLSYSSVKDAFGSNWAGSNLIAEDISLSPNFDNGFYTLSFSLPEEESTKVVVLDVAGNEIHSEIIEEFSGTYESKINVPVTQKGTYFLKIVQGFNLLNKKLVIE